MRSLIVFSLAICLAYSVYVPLPDPFTDFCILDNNTNLYNPADSNPNKVQWYTLDLDKPANERWQQIGQIYGQDIKNLIDALTNWLLPLMDKIKPGSSGFIYGVIMAFMEFNILPQIPQPYNDEIRGMADAVNSTGLVLGEIVMYNVFYEIFTVCTSVVAQDGEGHIYHARSLDFGLLMGWDNETHEWAVTENLRKMIFNLNWTRNGETVFNSVQFAGYIGVLSGMKPNAFSVTVNDRFMAEGGIAGIIEWMTGSPREWTTWLTREMFENETIGGFDEAVAHLSETPIMAPVYYIIGGSDEWEGVILARSLNNTDIVTKMDSANAKDGWYVLETNYDQGEDVLFLDDRRTPGHYCMGKLNQSNVGFQGLFNVLSSKTNLNMLTTYTTLMSSQQNLMETYIQYCSHPCYAY